MPRSTGNNWEICKIHEQLHVAENIHYYGAHHNVHTGSQEHNHIANTKQPSKQVQRKKLTLDWNLANRLSEKYLIDTAYYRLQSIVTTREPCQDTEQNFIHMSDNSKKFSFTIIRSTSNAIEIEYEWLRKSEEIINFPSCLMNALIKYFGNDIFTKTIYDFTEAFKGDLIF